MPRHVIGLLLGVARVKFGLGVCAHLQIPSPGDVKPSPDTSASTTTCKPHEGHRTSRCLYVYCSGPARHTIIATLRALANATLQLQSHKSFRTKQKLAKAQKQNRPIPQWVRLRTGNTIR